MSGTDVPDSTRENTCEDNRHGLFFTVWPRVVLPRSGSLKGVPRHRHAKSSSPSLGLHQCSRVWWYMRALCIVGRRRTAYGKTVLEIRRRILLRRLRRPTACVVETQVETEKRNVLRQHAAKKRRVALALFSHLECSTPSVSLTPALPAYTDRVWISLEQFAANKQHHIIQDNVSGFG